MTTDTQWRKVREQVFKEQKGKCAKCPRTFASHDDMHGHHAIYGRDVKFSKWLDRAENIVLLCGDCHEWIHHKNGNSEFIRDCFWTDKIDLGYDMETWDKNICRNDGQPMLIHDNRTYRLYLKKKDWNKRKEENGNKDIYKSQAGNLGS